MEQKFTFDSKDNKWHLRYLHQALNISGWSKDLSTKVGCIIVKNDKAILSSGYNGFPRGIDDNVPERLLRPLKYIYVVHAEVNAILNVARNGMGSTKDSIMYVTMAPCSGCAKIIVNAGIKEVIYLGPSEAEKEKRKNVTGWREEIEYSFKMFDESGVKHKEIPYADLMNYIRQQPELPER